MDLTVDQFVGCMLGLATGDALGAPYEGGLLERLVWRIIGRSFDGCLRWTPISITRAHRKNTSVRPLR